MDFQRPRADWQDLTEGAQTHLSTIALRQASETIAAFAEVLATEMEQGLLPDTGGPDTLRLFATLIRRLPDTEI